MIDIFIESMLCEESQTLDKFDVEIEEARIALLESVSPGSTFFEKGSAAEDTSGGIFQAIIRLIQACIKAIGDGCKKIVNWVTGAKVTPEGQTARIQGMDPNAVVKLVDGDLADATDALRKAASGQMTIEEAKAFIDKKEAVWKTLKSSAIPVVGLATFFIGKRFTVDKWTAEANAAKAEIEKMNRLDDPEGSDSKLASKVAHQFGSQAKRDAARDASNLIVNHMNQTTKRGFELLSAPIKEAFQKGYLTRQIEHEANLMGTKEGRRELKAKDKEQRKAVKAITKKEQNYGRNINKASKTGNRNLDRQIGAENDLDKTRRSIYNNYQ